MTKGAIIAELQSSNRGREFGLTISQSLSPDLLNTL
jgi:hypothetical protein